MSASPTTFGFAGGRSAAGSFAAFISFGMRWPWPRFANAPGVAQDPNVIDVEAVRVDGEGVGRGAVGSRPADSGAPSGEWTHSAHVQSHQLAIESSTNKHARARIGAPEVEPFNRYAPARSAGQAPRLLPEAAACGQYLDVRA